MALEETRGQKYRVGSRLKAGEWVNRVETAGTSWWTAYLFMTDLGS
jgi:hypothetical protein